MFIVPMNSVGSLGNTLASDSVTPKMKAAEIPFKDVLSNAYRNLVETQEVSSNDAYRLSMGQSDDLHTVMINSQKAETAISLTVQLTSRAMAAYNEIMRMQV